MFATKGHRDHWQEIKGDMTRHENHATALLILSHDMIAIFSKQDPVKPKQVDSIPGTY